VQPYLAARPPMLSRPRAFYAAKGPHKWPLGVGRLPQVLWRLNSGPKGPLLIRHGGKKRSFALGETCVPAAVSVCPPLVAKKP
jgi:hypothetical protein